MGAPVACVGDSFSGYCRVCKRNVTGTLVSGEFVTIEDKNICVTGSEGRGSCGHSCTVIGQSTVLTIENKPVARVGDPVTGDIEGTITSGSDFITAD